MKVSHRSPLRASCANHSRSSRGSFGGHECAPRLKKTASRPASESRTSACEPSSRTYVADARRFLLPTYKRPPVVMTHAAALAFLTPPQEVSRFSRRQRCQRACPRASAHRKSNPPRSRPCDSSLESLSQRVPARSRANSLPGPVSIASFSPIAARKPSMGDEAARLFARKPERSSWNGR